MVKQIAVGNLPNEATESDVKSLFAGFGQVVTIKLRGIGRDRVAYVDMSNDTQADSALQGLRNAKLGMNSLNVNEARPRE